MQHRVDVQLMEHIHAYTHIPTASGAAVETFACALQMQLEKEAVEKKAAQQ